MRNIDIKARAPKDSLQVPSTEPPKGPDPDTIVPEVANGPEKQQTDETKVTEKAVARARVNAKANEKANKKDNEKDNQKDNEQVNERTVKTKRKRSNMIDCEQLHSEIREHFNKDADKDPPLIHTPLSLFQMLCASFEQEYPKCLPQAAVTQILLSLKNLSETSLQNPSETSLQNPSETSLQNPSETRECNVQAI